MGTLTVASPDAQLQGRIRAFWHVVRQRWPRLVYFSWPELQERGVIHYHFLVPDGPGPREGFTQQWIRDTWGLGHVWLRWKKAHQVKGHLVDDVVAYVKKIGWKEYQQAYDTFPPRLRAFECTRLKTPYARLAMVAPLVAEFIERIGLGLVAAAKKLGGGAYRLLVRGVGGTRAPPTSVRVTQLFQLNIPMQQGTLQGFELQELAAA